MAKYTFITPYSTSINLGGFANPKKQYSWNIGDMVEAQVEPNKNNKSLINRVRVVVNPNPIQGGDVFAYIPLSVLNISTNTNPDRTQTQNTSENSVPDSVVIKGTPTKTEPTIKPINITRVVIGIAFIGTLIYFGYKALKEK